MEERKEYIKSIKMESIVIISIGLILIVLCVAVPFTPFILLFLVSWFTAIYVVLGVLGIILLTTGIIKLKRLKLIKIPFKKRSIYPKEQELRLDSDTALYKQSLSPASTSHRSNTCRNCGNSIPSKNDRCPQNRFRHHRQNGYKFREESQDYKDNSCTDTYPPAYHFCGPCQSNIAG